MKKLFYSFFAVIAAIVLVGCNGSTKVDVMAKLANAQCPVVVDETITLVKVGYDNGEFVYYYHIDDELLSVLSIMERDFCEEQLKEETKNGLNPGNDAEVAELFDVLIDADASLVYSYCDYNDVEHYRVVFTPEEMAEL